FLLKAHLFHDLHLFRRQPNSAENSRLLIRLLYHVFLINYCCGAGHADLNEPMYDYQIELAQIRSKFEKANFETALRAVGKFAADTEKSLFETIEESGWNLNHLLVSELFTDQKEPEEVDELWISGDEKKTE